MVCSPVAFVWVPWASGSESQALVHWFACSVWNVSKFVLTRCQIRLFFELFGIQYFDRHSRHSGCICSHKATSLTRNHWSARIDSTQWLRISPFPCFVGDPHVRPLWAEFQRNYAHQHRPHKSKRGYNTIFRFFHFNHVSALHSWVAQALSLTRGLLRPRGWDDGGCCSVLTSGRSQVLGTCGRIKGKCYQ